LKPAIDDQLGEPACLGGAALPVADHVEIRPRNRLSSEHRVQFGHIRRRAGLGLRQRFLPRRLVVFETRLVCWRDQLLHHTVGGGIDGGQSEEGGEKPSAHFHEDAPEFAATSPEDSGAFVVSVGNKLWRVTAWDRLSQ
jgi:hypothetical protein